MTTSSAVLFETSQIGGLKIRNKLAVAPMTRVSAQEDGTVGPLMQAYYEDYARGGFGLLISEGLYTDDTASAISSSRGSPRNSRQTAGGQSSTACTRRARLLSRS